MNQIEETFIWQTNPADAKKCKILAGLAKAGIAVAFLAIGASGVLGRGGARGAGAGAGAGTAGATTAASLVKIGADQAGSITNFVSFLYIIASIEDDVDRDPR